jgi:DNA polymerase III subunit delta'
MSVVSFDDIVGQAAPKRALIAAMRSDRVAGAYLFHGPRGVGKYRMARAFARALLCDEGGDDACGSCSACRRVLSENHPDVHVVGVGDDVTQIKIGDVREARARLSLKPLEGSRQIVIVDNADRLSEESGNALLKTLEEPPPGTVIVLVAAERIQVLETIRSRCQAIRFRTLGQEQVAAVLEGLGRVREDAVALSRLAGGSPGRAMALTRMGFPARAQRMFRRFLDIGTDDPVSIADDLAGRSEDKADSAAAARLATREVLGFLAHLARDAMVAAVGVADGTGTIPEEDVALALERFGRDPELWGSQLLLILEAARDIRSNVSIDLVLTDLVLDIEQAWKTQRPRRSGRPRSATVS